MRGKVRGMDYASREANGVDVGRWFPLAGGYVGSPAWDGRLRERADGRRFRYSERHLQTVWYDGMLRPEGLTTRQGDEVWVEDPGTWNLGPGPDFLGAVVRLGPDNRRVAGDVEVHIHPHDWSAHGHGKDPRYGEVRFHVTYFEGGCGEGELPPGAVEIGLQKRLLANPGFDFEAIDLTAYPFGERAVSPPCRGELAGWTVERKGRLVEAAGHERLLGKARRLAAQVEEQGVEQTFYEAFLVALGYRENKGPARMLARRLPVERLRDVAGGDELTAYAALAGMAGLLPDPAGLGEDGEAGAFVRECQDRFWRLRDRLDGPPMGEGSWALAGVRPLNHPARRLMAAARLVAGEKRFGTFVERMARVRPDRLVEGLGVRLEQGGETFWSNRAGWTGKRLGSRTALLGKDRMAVFVINVLVPLFAVTGQEEGLERGWLEALPVEPMNAVIRQAGFFLFGPDLPASFFGVRDSPSGVDADFSGLLSCRSNPLRGVPVSGLAAHIAGVDMKLATYNVNSIRSRLDATVAWLGKHGPDVLCLQETKVQDNEFPAEPLREAGYHVVFRGQKSYNGVAMLSRRAPDEVWFGFDDGGAADETRLLHARFGRLHVVNTYVPQGRDIDHEMYRYKVDWLGRMRRYFERRFTPRNLVAWVGDMNVAREPIDVYNPEKRAKHVCYHADARAAFDGAVRWGFTDVYRRFHPEGGEYTFYDYRTADSLERGWGWRIDYILASEGLAEKARAARIDLDPRRLAKASDHTYLVAEFDVTI